MYRGRKTLACPACGGELEFGAGSVVVQLCKACGGAWLGQEAAVHIMRGAGDAADDQIARAAEVAASGGAPSIAESDRCCPQCDRAMSALDLAGVRVESCPAHGTWFDNEEVKRVVERVRRLRDDGEKDTSLEDGAALVFAAVTLPFKFVITIFEELEAQRRFDKTSAYVRCTRCGRLVCPCP